MNNNDFSALQAQMGAQVALAGDLGQRALDAWRQIGEAGAHLVRQQLDATTATTQVLLRCADHTRAADVLIGQIHPDVERWSAWHDHVMDALGGVQSDAAVLARSYLPGAGAGALIDPAA